uniref:Uncharacterized protein n=1 Tax=Oryza punctata TaxID=4537 RepID=A0A0E0MD97_ORYPU
MTDIFRRKGVYPKSVLNPQRWSSSLLVLRTNQSLSAGQNGTIDYEAAEILRCLCITNGKPSNNGASTSVEERETEASVVTVDPRTSDASNSKGNSHLGSQNSAERNRYSSFNGLAGSMWHKIVKYLLACMPLPSTFFLDGREQVCFHGSVWSVQMCRSFHNRSAGLEFVSREEEEENALGQADVGSKRLTGPRRKEGGKERGFPLQLIHLKEVHPNIPCLLFTPICPHSLSFRPVILPDSARLELKIPDDARSNAWPDQVPELKRSTGREEDLSKAINLVLKRRNLVENNRVLLYRAHRAQQEYERTVVARTKMQFKRLKGVLRIANVLGVDEWYEQPAAIVVDWVTIDGQIVGAWINLV